MLNLNCLVFLLTWDKFFCFFAGVVYDSEYDLVSWASRRSVAEDVTDVSNSSLILAQDRTYRKDPSDGFKYYKGGWNISEEHYIYVSILPFKP